MRTLRFALCVLAVACILSPAVDTQPASCFVQADQGSVQGADRGSSCAFLGIPYAASPTGSLRWKPPEAAPAWSNVLPATVAPPTCPNTNAGPPAGNEDCLKLNLWVSDPLPGGSAPVIVWFHTGSFVAASANFPSHNGQRLAEETGAIVVAPNYRLGALGFLAHPALAAENPAFATTGNYGLLDQQAALRWVRDNIAAFGGDPGNVTIAGTSAGGDAVGLHLVAPGSAGLFHRAVIESGTPTIRWPSLAEANAQGSSFASALGCTDPADIPACLRAKTFAQVLLALPVGTQQVVEPPGRTFWLPVVDGVTIPDQPRTLLAAGAFNHVPTLLGATRDEAYGAFTTRSFPTGVSSDAYTTWVQTEFGDSATAVLNEYPLSAFSSPADAMGRLVTDGQFACESRRLARYIAEEHTPVFLFSYDYVIDAVFPGRAIHGVESNILFGNPYVPPQFPSHVLTPGDLALHESMAGYWARFALTGNPNTDDESVVHWPTFKDPLGEGRGANKHLVLDGVITVGQRQREAQCDFWESSFLRSMLGGVPAGRQ